MEIDGGCYCGAVRYKATGEMADVNYLSPSCCLTNRSYQSPVAGITSFATRQSVNRTAVLILLVLAEWNARREPEATGECSIPRAAASADLTPLC